MAPKRRLTSNKSEDQDSTSQNKGRNGDGVPSPYLEPPPIYNTMVTHAATTLRAVFTERDRLDLVLSQQKRLIDKQSIGVRKLQLDLEKDVKELWNTHKQEEIKMKTEPLVDGEGCSQPPAIPREMIKCFICMMSPSTMVWLPCRHLCACSGCDNKISTCPLCGTIKTSSFSFDLIKRT